MQEKQIQINEVSLQDKKLFDSYFNSFKPINSEYTFTNMFMWRKSYSIRYAIIDNMLCIFSKHGKSPETVNFPLGDGDAQLVINKLLWYFDSIGQMPLIRLYSKKDIKFLQESFPDLFIITEDIDSFDYVYKTSDLINLSGNKYHGKRNHINRFKSLYNYRYLPFVPELADKCLEVFYTWCDNKDGTTPNILEQRNAVTDLIRNQEFLEVSGGALTVDKQIVAFSFGEVLSAENSIAVIHLEHADTNFQGSFPTMNQQFLENTWSHLEYVNREEDMGLAGLRKAKQAYKPCLMVKKYIASLA